MAQKEINIKIKLQSKTDVQKQLDNIIKGLNINNIKLNIDLKDVRKDFATFQNTLNNISNNIQNIFKQNNFSGITNGIKNVNNGMKNVNNGMKNATKTATQLVNVMGKSLNIGNGTKAFSELQKRANEIRNTVDSMAKVSFNTTKNGNIKDATITYTNNMGKAVTETMKWKQVLDSTNGVVKRVFTTTNVKVSENIQNINNLNQKINLLKQSLGNKLNILSSNNLIDSNVISNLQNRLNSLNTKTPKSEIENLKLAINNLSSSESSIVRVQNKILQMESNLSNLKKTYSNTFSNSNNTSSIKAYENELNNLKNILNSLKNGQNINKNSISNSLNQATNASRNLSNSLKQNNSLLNQGNVNAKSLGNSLKQGLVNAGLYMTTYQAVRKIINLFKDAIDYVKEIDKYMTNIQMITNSSKSKVENMVNSYKGLTEELHATNTEMLAGIEEYSRAGYSEDMTKGMLTNSIRGSKLANQSVEETSNQLIAIRNAYDMTTEQVEEVTDALVTMDATASTTFSEVAKAMQNTAYSAQIMGTDFKDLISYITVASESTRKEPSEIGNSLKSIYSRYANIKLGNLDEDGKSINDTEKALEKIGIKIRDTKNQFRDFDDVLKEFMQKVKEGSISQVDMLAGVQALGGTRQKETLLAIINNMDRLNELQNAINEGVGSTKQKFDEIYSNSLEAKINDLKRATQDFYSNLVSSDGLKEGIELLTNFIKTFGNLPNIIGFATSALLIFKGKAITSLILGLSQYIVSIKKAISFSSSFKIVLGELNILFSKNPIGLITIALTGLATTLGLLKQKAEQAREEVEEFNKSFNEDYGSKIGNISNAENLLNNYKQVSNELKNLQSGTDEYKVKEEELKNIQEQLATIYPEINDLLNENYDNKSKLVEKTQELIDKDKKLTDSQAREALSKNDINSYTDLEKITNKYKDTKAYLDSLTKADNDNLRKSFIYWNDSEGSQQGKYFKNSKEIKDAISEATEESEKYSEAIKAIISAYQVLDEQGTQYEGLANKSSQLAKQLGIDIGNLSDKSNNYVDKIEELNNALSKLVETQEQEKEEAQSNFKETIKNIKESQELINNINENGLNADTQLKLLELYPELATRITDSAYCVEFLNNKIKEQGEAQKQAYFDMLDVEDARIQQQYNAVKDDTEYFNAKIKNSVSYKNYIQKVLNAMNQMNSEYYNANKERMEAELSNSKSLAQSKLLVEKNLTTSLAQLYKEYMTTTIKGLHGEDVEVGFNWEHGVPETEAGKQALAKYHQAKQYYEDLIVEIEKTSVDLDNINFGGVGNIGTNLGDSSTSDKKDYSVDNLENLYDRYLKINTAIDMLNNNLEILKEKQDNLVGSDYLNSLKQEINSYKEQQDLIKQKISEQEKERWNLRVKLNDAGFRFYDWDINSPIVNYESQLKALINSANAMADSDEKSAEAKKKAQERVKDLNEAIKDYNTLISQTIPNTQKEWETLNNSIKEVYETMSDLVADGESKMYDIFEYYADKKTEHLEEQLDLLDRLHGKETQQEELASKQSELAKIKEQMNLYELDNSANGKAKLKELQDQYNELLKEMNDTIENNQYEGIKQQMEDEKQAIEDSLKPENINKLINDGLVNGFIEVGNQTIQLNDAINDMTSNTVVGFQSMIKEANDYNDVIKNVQSTLKDISISSINSNLGYDTSAMTKAINNNTTNKSTYYSPNYTINVNASGLNEQTVSKMILDEIKEYDKTFKI